MKNDGEGLSDEAIFEQSSVGMREQAPWIWEDRAFHAEGTASGSEVGGHLLCSIKEELGTCVVGAQRARGRDIPPTPPATLQ